LERKENYENKKNENERHISIITILERGKLDD
jgi:hypothetical protein